MSDLRRWGDTTSKKGEVSRVFVGNLDSSIVCDDLENKFKRYGKISGIDINSNGFGFIQFDSVDDAKRAVQNEVGTMLKGRKLECRMFDKSGSKKNNRRDRSRSPVNNRRGGSGQFDHHNNHQSRGGGGSNLGGGGGGGMGNGPGPMFGGMGGGGGGGVMGGLQPPMSQQLPMPPSAAAGPAQQVNDVEIIVISKDQWAFAEMVERKIRLETGIKFIDILFLHSPQHISMTLNDLFERRTLYAVVIAPENEEHQTMTVHVLHNQMEYRNIPVDKAVGLISEDYQKFTFTSGGQQPSANSVGLMAGLGIQHPHHNLGGGVGSSRDVPSSSVFPSSRVDGLNNNSSNSIHHLQQRNGSSNLPPPVIAPPLPLPQQQQQVQGQQDKRLPEDVSYVLRTTLTEGGVQFLSLQHIDTVIDYFSRERERMTSTSSMTHGSRVQHQPLPLPPTPTQSVASSGYGSNYSGSTSSIYGPGIGQQNPGQNSNSMHMDKVPDVLKLVQESDVLQKLLASVNNGANQSAGDQSMNHSVHHQQQQQQQYNSHNMGGGNMSGGGGLNASRRGPHGGSGIGGADRGYGGRY